MTQHDEETATHLVDWKLASRLADAGDLPGLREATIALSAETLQTSEYENLIRQQLEQLQHTSSTAIPDAYLAPDAAADDALQRAAAGVRAALAENGHVGAGRTVERDLARSLGDDPRLAIRAELARVPRPLTRPAPLQWSIPPAQWAVDPRSDNGWPPPGILDCVDARTLPGGAESLARVESGRYVDWVQVALLEIQRTPAHHYPSLPARSTLLGLGLEIADGDRPAGTLPFASLPWQLWTKSHKTDVTQMDAEFAAAVLGRQTWSVAAFAEHRRGATGLGEPACLLAPARPIIIAFGLEPTAAVGGFSLSDSQGPALVCRLWRGHLVHDGRYHPLFPAVVGADLLMRPDLYERLGDLAGGSRMRVGLAVSYDEHVDEPDTTG